MGDLEHKEIFIVKRHAGHHDDHHGGAWKIAFADFMTAMMALFLVLWLIASTSDKTKRTVAQYFNPVKLVDMSTLEKGFHRRAGWRLARRFCILRRRASRNVAAGSMVGGSAVRGENQPQIASESLDAADPRLCGNDFASLHAEPIGLDSGGVSSNGGPTAHDRPSMRDENSHSHPVLEDDAKDNTGIRPADGELYL